MTGCVDREAQQQSKATGAIVTSAVHNVTTQAASVETILDTREINGQVTTAQDSTVGPKTGGKIVSVLVNDGDSVTAGQLIATQDTTQLVQQQRQALASISQAEAQVATAQSNLQQALQNAMYGPKKSSAAVNQARAQVRSAQAQLQKTLAGARPQERLQAEATLASAKSNLQTQEKELNRIRTLVEQGAMAGTKLDSQQAAFDAAKSNYDNAFQSVELLKAGNRQEDIDTARETLREAQDNLKTAEASKSLDSLYTEQVSSARASLESARAQVSNAQAQLAIANQALADAQIRAPFSGRISGKPVQPGVVLGSGGAVARIIGSGGIYFDGQVPSDVINLVKVGDPVKVKIDAIPGQTFEGHIAAINPLGSSFGRQFSLRTVFSGNIGDLKPGMFARGVVVLKSYPNATVLPLTAVVTKDGKKVVFSVENGKAHQIPVTLGLTQGDRVQVSGLPEKAQIVVKGQTDLVDGTQVKVESSGVAASNAAGTVGG